MASVERRVEEFLEERSSLMAKSFESPPECGALRGPRAQAAVAFAPKRSETVKPKERKERKGKESADEL